MKKLLFLFILSGICFPQTHTFPALDTSNTWSGTNDFSNVPLIRLRVATALTTSVNGDCGFDTTANNWHCWNGADAIVPLVSTASLPSNGQIGQFTVSGGKVTLGGIAAPQTISVVSHNFLTSFTASTGAFTQAQPTLADINGGIAPASQTYNLNSGAVTNGVFNGAGNGNSVVQVSGCAPQLGTGTTVTGNGSFQNLYSCTIPANVLGNGQCFDIVVGWKHITGSATVFYQFSLGGSAPGLAFNDSGSNPSYSEIYICNNPGTQTSQTWFSPPSFAGSSVIGTPGLITSSVNMANAQLLAFQFSAAATDQVQARIFIPKMIY